MPHFLAFVQKKKRYAQKNSKPVQKDRGNLVTMVTVFNNIIYTTIYIITYDI